MYPPTRAGRFGCIILPDALPTSGASPARPDRGVPYLPAASSDTRKLVKGGAILDTHTDVVDQELDRLISKRALQDRHPDPDEQEELWKASVRAHNARRRAENAAAWLSYHRDQAERHRRTLEDLIAHHETQAARLCEEGRI